VGDQEPGGDGREKGQGDLEVLPPECAHEGLHEGEREREADDIGNNQGLAHRRRAGPLRRPAVGERDPA
jgi:hypothetical protein